MTRMRPWLLAAACGLSALSAHRARAETPDRYGPRNAVSIHPLVLPASGAAVQYERYVLPPRFSLATGLGYRRGAGGSFQSHTTSAGIELKLWLLDERRFRGLGSQAMVGPFVAGRLDQAWTLVTHRLDDRYVGGQLTLMSSASLGFRLPLANVVELSPSVGVGGRLDIDPQRRLAPLGRVLLRGGLTAGVLF